MSGIAVVMMFGICGLVWGGFLTLLVWALRSERARGEARNDG